MLRPLRLLAIAVIACGLVGAVPAALANAPLFQTETAAHQHCPKDTVVWLNTQSGVYHFRGQRWYGRTRNGAFACRREVDRDGGGRATRNGQ